MVSRLKNAAIPVGLFVVAFCFHTLRPLAFLEMMPGDLGDARLNNYFLENIYQYLAGNSASLIHLPFFYPLPYVGGFSDNLFGSAPVYIAARWLTGQSDTAFQVWFLFSFPVNYLAAYYSLRALGLDWLSAATGALIFAFALPVSGHAGHAQLHYRFGVPLASVMLYFFLDRGRWNYLAAAIGWLVWQYYCSIYIGFFLSLLMASMIFVRGVICVGRITSPGEAIDKLRQLIPEWNGKGDITRWQLLLVLGISACAILLLFYPYVTVAWLYQFKRSWAEISSMLPRPQSYLLSFASDLWPFSSHPIFENLPMSWEHQMFMGAGPILLAVTGYVLTRKSDERASVATFSGALVTLIILTLSINGFSLWWLFHKLPLASAIRAMTRIDLVMLFPVSFLAATGVSALAKHFAGWPRAVSVAIIAMIVTELSMVSLPASPKQEWRERLARRLQEIPPATDKNAILFFAQSEQRFYMDELDAMWATLLRGQATLNGYSGSYPRGFSLRFEDDCSEYPRRIADSLKILGKQGDVAAYKELASRVVVIGFHGCDASWREQPPRITTAERDYTADEIRNLTIRSLGRQTRNGVEFVNLKVSNAGHIPISARSPREHEVRLSWRFLDRDGAPFSGWETRASLPFDIPAHGGVDISIRLDARREKEVGAMEVSIVQERVFWAHDIGIQPLQIKW